MSYDKLVLNWQFDYNDQIKFVVALNEEQIIETRNMEVIIESNLISI